MCRRRCHRGLGSGRLGGLSMPHGAYCNNRSTASQKHCLLYVDTPPAMCHSRRLACHRSSSQPKEQERTMKGIARLGMTLVAVLATSVVACASAFAFTKIKNPKAVAENLKAVQVLGAAGEQRFT